MLPVIITPLTYEQEALRFAGQHDDETRVSPFARYNANLHGHDEDAMGIESILSKNGMRVVKHSGVRGGVHAVGAIVAIYKAHGGPELLDRTMRVISRVYGDDPDATQSHMILGLSGFLKKFPSISDEELIEKLSRAEGHPNRLAMSAGMYGPVSKGVGMARAILDLWNKGRRSQRLEW